MYKNVTPKLQLFKSQDRYYYNEITFYIFIAVDIDFFFKKAIDIDYYLILFYSLMFIELKNSLSSDMIIKENLSSDYDIPIKEIGYIVIFQN